MKQLAFFIIFVSIATGFFVACSQSNNGINTTGISACTIGQMYSQELNLCLAKGSCATGQGYYPQGSRCVTAIEVTAANINNSTTNTSNSLWIGDGIAQANTDAFKTIFQNAGYCYADYYWSWTLFGKDPYNCDTWTERLYLKLRGNSASTNGNQLTVTIGGGYPPELSGATAMGYNNYREVPFAGIFYPVNNNQGFEIRGNVAAIRSEKGSLQQNPIAVYLKYFDQVIGSAMLIQY